jgi:tetratricopeptide (TPR) repeat protein
MTKNLIMKNYTIKGLLFIMAIVVFATNDIQAQTYEDVVNGFNEATEMAKAGKNREAITAFERIITMSDRVGGQAADIKTRSQNQIPQLYFLIARDLYQAQRFIPAAEAFAVAAEQATKYGNQRLAQQSRGAIPQLYFTEGNRLFREENYAGALANYDKAIAARPNYAAAYYQKGLVYRQQENMDEALNFFDRAIQVGGASNEGEIVSNATNAARNFLLLNGVNRMEARQYNQATELLRQALQYDDSNADVHYRLAEVYNKRAMSTDAITHANRALELERGSRTDRAKIYFELAIAQSNAGDFSAACTSYREAAVGSFRAAAVHAMEHELKCSTP